MSATTQEMYSVAAEEGYYDEHNHYVYYNKRRKQRWLEPYPEKGELFVDQYLQKAVQENIISLFKRMIQTRYETLWKLAPNVDIVADIHQCQNGSYILKWEVRYV